MEHQSVTICIGILLLALEMLLNHRRVILHILLANPSYLSLQCLRPGCTVISMLDLSQKPHGAHTPCACSILGVFHNAANDFLRHLTINVPPGADYP